MRAYVKASILSRLLKDAIVPLTAALVATIVHGACVVLVVKSMTTAVAMSSGDVGAFNQERFAWLIALLALAQLTGNLLFVQITKKAHAQAREMVCRRILSATLQSVEASGDAAIEAALAEHCPNVVRPIVLLPVIIASAVTIVGCLIFMALLSLKVLVLMLATLSIGVGVYRLSSRVGMRHFDRAATEQTNTFSYFLALGRGAKELKLSAARAQRFEHLVLGPSIRKVAAVRALGMSTYVTQASFVSLLVFGLVWVVLYVILPSAPDRLQVATGFALCMAYVIGPMEALLVNAPQFGVALAAARKIEELLDGLVVDEVSPMTGQRRTSIELRDASFRYHSSDGRNFCVGPVTFELRAGQVIFLMGGNGSGKSTLAKMVAGLYPIQNGSLLIDGVNTHQGAQRELFAAVFPEYYLFDPWLGCADERSTERANDLLDRFQLSHKVRVEDGCFTTTELSTGQRKRLALITALVEDRQFYVFDEWAADQDSAYRDVFYRQLLPELKKDNKAVLVITHDRHYCDVADLVVEIRDGSLVCKG